MNEAAERVVELAAATPAGPDSGSAR
jgi:hypothetical protein